MQSPSSDLSVELTGPVIREAESGSPPIVDGPCESRVDGKRASISLLILALLSILPLGHLCGQGLPQPDEKSFDIEPPLLVAPGDVEQAPPDADQLEKELERAQKSAAFAEREVKVGVLAKVEAEQRALRVIRLEAELAEARLTAAEIEAEKQKAASEANKADLDAATSAVAQATAAAQNAQDNYRKAQLDAAELNLRRQRRLLALGSARKSDVARAEDKLAALQRGEEVKP
jgi:hypothetical protein